MGYARHTGRRYCTLVRLAEQQALSSLTSREMLKVLSVNPREDELYGDQRRMGGRNDLSQRKGALKGTMNRCEFTDKTLALSKYRFPFRRIVWR